jgi:hypothetical protein
MMHNSQGWIWPNQRECLFYEKTVISTSFLIIHYGLTCRKKAHGAILGQDCTAFFRIICPREKQPCLPFLIASRRHCSTPDFRFLNQILKHVNWHYNVMVALRHVTNFVSILTFKEVIEWLIDHRKVKLTLKNEGGAVTTSNLILVLKYLSLTFWIRNLFWS